MTVRQALLFSLFALLADVIVGLWNGDVILHGHDLALIWWIWLGVRWGVGRSGARSSDRTR